MFFKIAKCHDTNGLDKTSKSIKSFFHEVELLQSRSLKTQNAHVLSIWPKKYFVR